MHPVLLADEQGLFREAVRIVLAAQPDIEVVAEAGDERRRPGTVAVSRARRRADLLALDGYDGSAAARDLRGVPHAGCSCWPPAGPSTLADAFEAGASGHLSKQSPVSSSWTRSVRARQGILVPPGSFPA